MQTMNLMALVAPGVSATTVANNAYRENVYTVMACPTVMCPHAHLGLPQRWSE